MIKKVLIAIFAVVCLSTATYAKPFLSCDSQVGVTQYKIETPVQLGVITHWERIVPALEGGVLMWDLGGATGWPHGKGLFDGTVSAGGNWEVVDVVTEVKTTVFEYSESSDFTIKVPSYKVKNIRGR